MLEIINNKLLITNIILEVTNKKLFLTNIEIKEVKKHER